MMIEDRKNNAFHIDTTSNLPFSTIIFVPKELFNLD